MSERDLKSKDFLQSASQACIPSGSMSPHSIPPVQSVLPLCFSVPSSKPGSSARYVVEWDGSRWCCTCEHYRRTGGDCRHILEKRLETKGRGLFSGVTVEPLFDEVRLTRQYKRVWGVMVRGDWMTLSEVALESGDPLQSISARLRDFRKARFGGHFVDRRRKGDAKQGLWEYRLTPNSGVKVVVE